MRLGVSPGMRLLALWASLLGAPVLPAQPAGSWQVELVAFDYREAPASNEQVLQPAAPSMLPPPAPLLPPSGDGSAALPFTRYPLLEPEALQLGGVRQRLARSGELRPLLHLGWQQDAPARRGAARPQELPPVDGSRGLQGTVRLYRRQSLHVELDLWLPAAAGDDADGGEPGGYRLRETRIVRSGELGYFDHPRFGVVLKVSPVADTTN